MNQTQVKIIWLCNCPLGDTEVEGTGTWLGAMARGVLDSGAVELGIIAPGQVKQFTRHDYHKVKQWLIPIGTPLGRDGLPRSSLVSDIVAAVNDYAPGLVHIWGTEGFWGLLTARGLLTFPSLLEIQGLKGEIANVFYGGLTLLEQLRCIGIKELLKRRTMSADQRDFKRWGFRDKEIISGHHFVDVQSAWVASRVKDINFEARLFPVALALRQPFYKAESWQPPNQPTIFCMAAYTAPFKGLHVAVRAFALLKKRIPGVRLRIAGGHQRVGIRQDGYMRWLNRMIRYLGLNDAIEWLGPLNAEQIVFELNNAAAAVIPTFIETYCVVFAEAMAIGTPVVVSYVGGTSSLGSDEISCLFFPPGDEKMCAYQLERVLTDKELALRLSQESRKIATVRNDRERIVQRQLEIYRQVVEKPC
jgi:glycosyltransferase involved in cell wall biosynthesis